MAFKVELDQETCIGCGETCKVCDKTWCVNCKDSPALGVCIECKKETCRSCLWAVNQKCWECNETAMNNRI